MTREKLRQYILFFFLWPLIVIGYIMESIGKEKPKNTKKKRPNQQQEPKKR